MIIMIITIIMKIPLLGRHGPDPIPVWVLPYGGCRRDPRNPQGAAAVKLETSKSTSWLPPSLKGGRPSGWWGKSIWSKHNCCKNKTWLCRAQTEDNKYVFNWTNKQTGRWTMARWLESTIWPFSHLTKTNLVFSIGWNIRSQTAVGVNNQSSDLKIWPPVQVLKFERKTFKKCKNKQ